MQRKRLIRITSNCWAESAILIWFVWKWFNSSLPSLLIRFMRKDMAWNSGAELCKVLPKFKMRQVRSQIPGFYRVACCITKLFTEQRNDYPYPVVSFTSGFHVLSYTSSIGAFRLFTWWSCLEGAKLFSPQAILLRSRILQMKAQFCSVKSSLMTRKILDSFRFMVSFLPKLVDIQTLDSKVWICQNQMLLGVKATFKLISALKS